MQKFLLLSLALIFSVALIADPRTAEEEIELIKKIQELTRNATWTPGITSVSNYTQKERQQICGLFDDNQRVVEDTDEFGDVIALGYVDLRGKGIITPVKNQGRCGSCWAFAAVACIEAMNQGRVDLSEQELVSCCTSSSGCNGGYIGSTFQWAISNGGVLTESVYPYTSGSNGQTGSCFKKSGSKYSVSSYSSCTSNSSVKAALDRGYPVDTGMRVYSDFMHYKSGIYKHTSGAYEGGHAVAIVGYNDAEGCWIVKNSWGTGWGESGYVRMGYDEASVPWMAAYARK